MPLKPRKWLLYSPVAILPFLAAMSLGTGPAQQELLARAATALESASAPWAHVTVSGRDAVVTGLAPTATDRDRALAALAGVAGLRRIDAAGLAAQN